MIGYIYKTTDLTNGKIYIGKHEAEEFDLRYLGSGSLLKIMLKAHGKQNFICELLDTAETLEELWEKEYYWVEELHARDPAIGYNLFLGGLGGIRGGTKIIKDDIVRVIHDEEMLAQYLAEGWVKVKDLPKEDKIYPSQLPEYRHEQAKRPEAKKAKHNNYRKSYTEHKEMWKQSHYRYCAEHKDQINEQRRKHYQEIKEEYNRKRREKRKKKKIDA